MRPLPRLHAVTDDAVLTDADVGIRAAAIAAVGPAAALHVRARHSTAAFLARSAARFVSLATPAEAAVIVNARPDIARGVGAQGVQLGAGDLSVADARTVLGGGRIGRSVHGLEEARGAVAEGADFLLAGTVFPSASHPGQPALGLAVLAQITALGVPVIAIGGITPERAQSVKDAGAWGVAAITALWHAADPYAAAVALLAPWSDAA
ncbi:MAG TPA: thiamine phosphate synthase [Gemmatimonadales bacterium]|nr:thiamine phosphate synthase [Gemmatimonadales bacterium]